jgi:hypothetical protein
MVKHRYTEEELRHAISSSRSIREALITLGISCQGGNYRVIHKAVAKYNIDISHFSQQGWAKGQVFGPKRDIKDYLSNQYPISSFKLKNRLLEEGLLERVCSNCSSTTWLNEPIPLELDHIDGDNENNNFNNLRLLCPNCHALTPTYRGKNKKK